MSKKLLTAFALSLAALAAVATVARAYSSDHKAFNDAYAAAGTRLDDCVVCHVDGEPKSVRNPYGEDYKEAMEDNGYVELAAFAAIANMDSDGDGPTNIMEIAMLTFPGDPDDPPEPTPTPTPVTLTNTPLPPTDTPLPPTDTPLPPTATPTDAIEPSPTPIMESSPTDTPAPSDEYVYAMADLVGRKGWAEPHKYELPKDFGTPLNLYGRVKNTGAYPTMVQVHFEITDKYSGLPVDKVMTGPEPLAPGDTIDLSANWANPSVGRYWIYAQVWYDSDGNGSLDAQGEHTKRIKLDVKAKGFVDLAKRKAWADVKHFDPSKGDGVLMLHAIVENTGKRAADVQVHFQIMDHDTGNPLMELMTDVVELGPDKVIELSADWVDPPLGEYKVLASVWYDSDGNGSLDYQGRHTKEFRVEIEFKD